MQKVILILFFVFVTFNLSAQKAEQLNSWWYYSGSYKFTNKIGLKTFSALCRNDFIKNPQLSLLRIGVKYSYLKNLSIISGYERATLFPYGEFPVSKKRTEHRLYIQLLTKNNFKTVNTQVNIQLEQRFIESKIKYRCRVKMKLKTPIFKTESLGFSLSNQLLLNICKVKKSNYLGQNRAYIGFSYKIIKALVINIGYLNQYIIIDDTKSENNHTLMVGLSHKLDFK